MIPLDFRKKKLLDKRLADFEGCPFFPKIVMLGEISIQHPGKITIWQIWALPFSPIIEGTPSNGRGGNRRRRGGDGDG